MTPPKPQSRPEKVSFLQHVRLFRKDLFQSQPERLYRAWMAEFKLPFFRSYFVNQPELVKTVLNERPDDFPKSEIIKGALGSLLGDSVFVTNGPEWKRQRRIIDPAFEGGKVKYAFPSMKAAVEDAVIRLRARAGEVVEIEEEASKLAADIIFRTLFSIPITDAVAEEVFYSFRDYQRTQPLMNVASFLKRPDWFPAFQRRSTKKKAAVIRKLLTQLTDQRAAEIEAGTAPDDLATKIMTTQDPLTGERFTRKEMVDQVAIFFLAGHETSASALAWTLYCIAADQPVQDRMAKQVRAIEDLELRKFSKMPFVRDVFREGLRLYPPVPMMVREVTRAEEFRQRQIKVGSQIVLSPWHLGRHQRFWEDPDVFDPDRWGRDETKEAARQCYIPFSSGPRVCTGASFAMVEGVLSLAMMVDAFKFSIVPDKVPVPQAHLTVRAKDGIYLKVENRE
ncbi:MAG: cytochrome P450 [Pseudomonadota bacterium]